MWLDMCRGGGQASDWVMIGLDPACPEPDTELQLRAAVLLVLTWDIRKGTGVRSCPVFFLQWVNGSWVLLSRVYSCEGAAELQESLLIRLSLTVVAEAASFLCTWLKRVVCM